MGNGKYYPVIIIHAFLRAGKSRTGCCVREYFTIIPAAVRYFKNTATGIPVFPE